MSANLIPSASGSPVSIRPDSWMNGDTLTHLCRLAEMMAGSKVTVPTHLAGNNGDCLAVCMQAMQWGMNPFSVAQKTHLVQGNLGYEGQLVNAVVTSMAPTKGRLEFEFFGPWEKVIGKFKMETSPKGNKYAKTNWSDADEEGVGVRVFATLQGEDSPRSIDILLKQCWPRNSTQWATDPQQQITYVAVKKWARRYCPDVILGVYTPDELEQGDVQREPKDITPQAHAISEHSEKMPAWVELVASGKKTAQHLLEFLAKKGISLTEEEQLQLINAEVTKA
ncbi:RecT family recombinase [Vibrio rhizosphaerae]|uniref:RecT family recombinase n=1 Tax=Vibrio rhizosphaerae TaxID=398736 RepID=A0ABU4IX92_9VIBR|nr:RecT family recombinase [Vibrio rhizosphaerae]MDW6094022.1 RecT family recombinase [Vibrio rhizosphaerae]